MTNEELLRQLYDLTLVGNKPAVLELTQAGLAAGMGPETLLYEPIVYTCEGNCFPLLKRAAVGANRSRPWNVAEASSGVGRHTARRSPASSQM